MKREGVCFVLALVAHSPLIRLASGPSVVGPGEPPLVVWQPPSATGARRGSGTARRLPGVGESTTGAAAPAEWWTLGQLAADGNRPPAYPQEALDREWEGTVGLRVEFSESGEARGISVESSSGFPVLDEAAVTAARAWRIPAAGRSRQVRVPVRFELSDAG